MATMPSRSWVRSDATALVHFEVADSLDDQEMMSSLLVDRVSKSLVSRSHPVSSPSLHDFRKEYWRAECLSKFPFSIEGVDRAQVALDGFTLAEQRCEQANLRLGYFPNPYCQTSKVVRRARAKLKWLLSGISPDEVMQRAHWGPGATTQLRRSEASPQNKWVLASHITSNCLPWLDAFQGWSGRKYSTSVVSGNKIVTVPKNAKTDRLIAIEPDWNSFFQLGLGGAIRRRLQRVGILLPTAQTRNRKLAMAGSLTGLFATIDLKAASDTISLGLCDLLLPPDLFELILSLRSPFGSVNGEQVEYAKVSSMGNGFTFELETAMFWALACSCDPSHDAAVYGDDIIVTTDAASLLMEVLTDLHMEVNPSKTFTSGPFRESCGGHYYAGIEVTPPYFREQISCVPSYIRAYNKLVAAFGRSDTSEYLRSKVPKYTWGPASRGDTVLRSEWDEACPTWNRRYQSYELKEVVETRKMASASVEGGLLHALWGASYASSFPTKERVVRVQRYTADRWSK